jgi:hypothetical protein
MDLIHSTFQASFNARIERLAEQEANQLRTVGTTTSMSIGAASSFSELTLVESDLSLL